MFTTDDQDPPTVRACPLARARLDADKASKPLTRIVTHPRADNDGMCVCLANQPLVDPELVHEDGTRISLIP